MHRQQKKAALFKVISGIL